MSELQDQWGYEALDHNGLTNRLQFSTKSGCAVSPGTNALTVQCAAGEVVHDGNSVSVAAQDNVALAAADGSNPRKDVVYVDSTGTLQVATGTAEAAKPSGQTHRSTYRPAPADLSATAAVVLAEVWVAAGAADIAAGDVSERRLFADAVFNSVGAEELAGCKIASSWGELKTKVEASGRGDYVTVVQGDSDGVLNADSLITVPRFVNVDLKAVEVVPQSDTQDLWDVGEGAHVQTGKVLPSSTYSATVFKFDGDRGTINYWEDTWVGGKIQQTSGSGTFIGHGFVQAAGGSVAGVTVDTVQRGGNAYATFTSSDATGYLNGNRFRGRVFGAVDGIRVDNATGAVDGNHFIGMGLHAKSRTDNVLDLAGRFWWGMTEIWDLGTATNGINFQAGSTDGYIIASHTSVPGNISPGGTDNRVHNLQDNTVRVDTGSAMVLAQPKLEASTVLTGIASGATSYFNTGITTEDLGTDTLSISAGLSSAETADIFVGGGSRNSANDIDPFVFWDDSQGEWRGGVTNNHTEAVDASVKVYRE